MKKILRRIRDVFRSTVKGLASSGFFHIFGAGTVNKVIAALVGLVLVHLLSKEDYGVYAYAANILGLVILFNGLGVTSAVLQICSEYHGEQDRSDAVLYHAYRWGLLVEAAFTAVIVFVALFVPLPIEGSNMLLGLYCLYPLAYLLFELKTMQLRVAFKNKEYAYATSLQTICTAVFSVSGALFFQAVGLVVGQTVAYVVAYFVLCIKHPFRVKKRPVLSREGICDFWKIALISALNNGMSSALSFLGTFLVGLYLASDVLVAEYQVATMIPSTLMFIPVTVMIYAYPYFANKRHDKAWTIRNYAKLLLGLSSVMGSIVALLIIFANPVVCILFGEDYLDMIPAMNILLFAYLLASVFRTPAGNLLVTQRRLVSNLVVSIGSIGICVLASYLLIPSIGIEGAAFAFMATMAFSSAANFYWYVRSIARLPDNTLREAK